MTKSRNIIAKRVRWTDYEDAVIRAHYPGTLTADLAEILGRPKGAVHQRAALLGVSKSREFVAALTRERIAANPAHGSRLHRIQPGTPAWNKGLKGVVGMQEACRATQFKPGRPASEARNYQPIGTTRITKDGYLERKTTDDPSLAPARRWVAVARLVWEQANGPVPAGHAIVFKPGQHTTVETEITLGRLECLSRAELMKRNTGFPIEIRRIHQLRGAITRQINQRAKEVA